jgi:hypothetical protein
MHPQADPDQYVLDENGQLKEAKDIPFFHSPSDRNPIPLPPVYGDVRGAVADDGGMPWCTIFLSIINFLHPSSSW